MWSASACSSRSTSSSGKVLLEMSDECDTFDAENRQGAWDRFCRVSGQRSSRAATHDPRMVRDQRRCRPLEGAHID